MRVKTRREKLLPSAMCKACQWFMIDGSSRVVAQMSRRHVLINPSHVVVMDRGTQTRFECVDPAQKANQ